ncbi:MAG: L,D-transpeptidase [Bacilli bacterium]
MRFFLVFLLLQTLLYPLGDVPRALVVNKHSNTLVVVENGAITDWYRVATGRTKDLTPEGRFTVKLLAKDPYYIKGDIPGGDPKNPLGSRWIGFDALGTDGSKYGIHGTNAPWTIGTYASSGCVRMRNREVSQVFDRMRLGDTVIIVDKPQSMEEIVASLRLEETERTE